jgi:serine/threonine-protein kinase RsbW
MEIKLTLALPRDEYSVPVARRVLKSSMEVLGVCREVVQDIEVALTEACTNVLDHAGDTDEYDVSLGIDGAVCVIEVLDRGTGFDGSARGLVDADVTAEDGRGIQIMRALVDRVTFTSRPTEGTLVHLEKALEWDSTSPVGRRSEESAGDGPHADSAEAAQQRA